MAAGDLVTADYHLEIRTTLFGKGVNGLWLDQDHIAGLGVPDTKTQDSDLAGQDGFYAGPDFLAGRMLTIAVIVKAASQSALGTNLQTLNTAWAPSATDIPLYLRIPEFGKFHVNGRPRGHAPSMHLSRRGVFRTVLRFDCPDPTITVP